MITCKVCGEEKEDTEFTSSKSNKCKMCVSDYNREYRIKNQWALKLYEDKRKDPDRWRKYSIKARAKQYGLTEQQYRDLYDVQGGQCAICGIEIQLSNWGRGKGARDDSACIDHNHETNEVRGLLCRKCNALLGQCNDNVNILEMAIAYLTQEKLNGVSR